VNKRARKKLRTALLGAGACAALFWGAVDLVGVPPINLLMALGWVSLGVLFLIVLAVVPGVLLSKRRQRR